MENDQIGQGILNYFNSIFVTQSTCSTSGIIRDSILKLVTTKDSDILCAIPADYEIRETMFRINGAVTQVQMVLVVLLI